MTSGFTDTERTLQSRLAVTGVGKVIAIDLGVREETVSRWRHGDWPIPAYQAFAVSASQQDFRFLQALATRANTHLRLIPRTYIEQPQALFFLLANHMAVYAELLAIVDKAKKGPLTAEDREKARHLLDQFRDFTEQIAVQIEPQDLG